ncbi:hypothetical protein BJX63DRAFT_444783 [Aspergillus granulosus]|uniref:Uncharacterized protein n=1 Tax=Aspergillus granulosus TaxID=176169 RepID=A0ABR4H4I8_9EURO
MGCGVVVLSLIEDKQALKLGASKLYAAKGIHKDSFDITPKIFEVTNKANIPNVCFMSMIDLEAKVLKGDPITTTGHPPVVVRWGLYAENIPLYLMQVQEEGTLPIPIKKDHNTGFMLTTGDKLATAVSKSLGEELKFDHISEVDARHVLNDEASRSDGEIAYLFEYFSPVRKGKTNYISTTAFRDVTGKHPQELEDSFKASAEQLHLKWSNKGGRSRGSEVPMYN